MNLLAAGTPVCDLQSLAEGQAQGFTLGEGEWPLRGLVVMHQGEVRAFVNQCPHAGHRLDFPPGRFLTPDGELLLCRSHGAVFDKASGECVAGPCTGERLRPLEVAVVGAQVQLTADVDVDALVTRYW
jgi:nitrite reductase/ring-hydroxylating ferredoxin subunit